MEAIIFDLDGTLLNTINTIEYYCNKSLAAYGFGAHGVEEYKLFVGNGARLLIERAMNSERTPTESEFNKVFALYNELYNADTLYLTEPYEGIIDMLRSLKKEGIKTAVLSNKPHIATEDVVKEIFGDGLFDAVQGAVDGVPLKPDPTAAFNIMKKLGVTPDKALFVGDTKVDIATGKGAGLCSIGVLWGFRGEAELTAAGADVIVDTPEKITEIAMNM